MDEEQRYREEVLGRVCPGCIDANSQGDCLLAGAAGCAVKRFFPQVVAAVRSVYSVAMEPYEAALREKVCSGCVQLQGGKCLTRDHVDCALDRYLPMIVQAVEELDLVNRFASPKTAWK